MPRIAYRKKKFGEGSLDIIAKADHVLREYAADGYEMNLRQLYYQFVSRDWIANKDSEYKRIGKIIADARMAGLLDWNHLDDLTRHVRSFGGFENPEEFMETAFSGYSRELWEGQENYVEVWVEKDALVSIVGGAAGKLRTPFFSCRGYSSQSSMWRAANRLGKVITDDRKVTILHLGDHDPSGIDMTRDIDDRLSHFIQGNMQVYEGLSPANAYATTRQQFEVKRIALTMDQIDAYGPPPNPAKITDSRAKEYIYEHGHQSWELDALTPKVLEALITSEIRELLDIDLFNENIVKENEESAALESIGDRWPEIQQFLKDNPA